MTKLKNMIPEYPCNNIVYDGEVFIDITDNTLENICDYYMISNYGRVYNKYLKIILKPSITMSGYLFVMLYTKDGKSVHIDIHRIVMSEFYKINGYKQLQVNHKDGLKWNNIDTNLEWMTRSENIQHSYDTGLHKRNSNILEDDIRKVCDLLQNGYEIKDIVNIVGNGVTYSIVADIKKGQSWVDISQDYTFYQRKGKLLDYDTVSSLCMYFSTHYIGSLTINDHCRNAMSVCGLEQTQNNLDSVRKIYTRKNYINISRNYNF